MGDVDGVERMTDVISTAVGYLTSLIYEQNEVDSC